MSRRFRRGLSSAVLVCLWSGQAGARDLATIYCSQPEPDHGESRPHGFLREPSAITLPAPVAWACSLDGVEPLRQEALRTYLDMIEWGDAPSPDLDFSTGGMRGGDHRSYFNMVTRGSAVIIGSELAMMGVMMMLPREAMKWEPDFVQDAARNLGKHVVTPPVWDEDDWRLNYLGHPYAGSIYYNTVRAQGASPWQSFLFALGASTFWEYGVEATAEPASTQDLIVTPVAGALLGELVHHLTLAMKKDGTSVLEGIAITVLNPTHVVMKGY